MNGNQNYQKNTNVYQVGVDVAAAFSPSA